MQMSQMLFSIAYLMKQFIASSLMDSHSRASVSSFSMLFMAYIILFDYGNKSFPVLLKSLDFDRLRKNIIYLLTMMEFFFSFMLMISFYCHARTTLSKHI